MKRLKEEYPFEYHVMGGIINPPCFVPCRIIKFVEDEPWYTRFFLKLFGLRYQIEWVCEYGIKVEWVRESKIV